MHSIINEDAAQLANMELPWEMLEGKTVLITGANGYVPAYFTHAFLKRNDLFASGINVIALCRNEARARDRFSEYLDRSDFKILIQDVCEPVKLADPVHFIIHAASPAGTEERYKSPVGTFGANVGGTERLLELCRDKKSERFLYISSVDIYGNTRSENRLTESCFGSLDSANIRNVYSVSKKAAEMLCISFFAEYQTPVVIARPAQIMGPGISINDGRLHIDFISQMLKANEIVLKSDGSARRSFMYISDAISGMLYVLLKGNLAEAYNVANEQGEATVLELANIMAVNAPDKETTVRFDLEKRNNPEVTHAVSNVTIDSKKLQSLGWTPQISLSDGAKRMMTYYGL